MTDFATVDTGPDRDRYGRPLIKPPGGGKPVAYTRATTFVGCLEDTFNLSRWQMRMVALGLADRPDLLLSVAAHRDDKAQLNRICEDAQEAAKAHAAATTGTALHALTEIVDRGEKLPVLPGDAAADLDAYRATTAPLDVVAIEQFGVVDDLKVGGTWDRIVQYRGRHYIGDVKTGSIDWGIAKIAMQLAVYSRATPYDHRTGTRTPFPYEVDQDQALVIHLPAGTATCQLVWVDIAAGWEGVALARQVRAWRTRKGLSSAFTDNVVDVPLPEPLSALIAAAPSYAALLALHAAHAHEWTPTHTAAAAARRADIEKEAVA